MRTSFSHSYSGLVQIQMLDSLTLTVQFTKDDYVRVLRYMSSTSFWIKYGPLVVFGILFVGIFGFILFLSAGQYVSIPAALFVSFLPATVAATAVYLADRFITSPLLSFSIGRQLRSSPLSGKEVSITIDNEGVSIETELSSSLVKWDGFIRGVETETDFLFYTTNKFSHFFPKSAFTSELDVNFVRCIARAGLGDKADF